MGNQQPVGKCAKRKIYCIPQQLTHDFRLDYAHFWLSILNADKAGIKKYADRLGCGQLYGLFACMVAGR